MEEIWKPIKGYEGRYEVSNYGRIKSYVTNKNGSIIKGTVHKDGYQYLIVSDANHNREGFYVHRIVATHFIDNPNNYQQVNHIDENKLNNRVDNLEWCTASYNVNYGSRNTCVASKNTNHPSRSKPVFSIDSDGAFCFYDSVGEAERQTGLSHGNIVRALKGHTPRCGGRFWFYSITTPTHHLQRLSEETPSNR